MANKGSRATHRVHYAWGNGDKGTVAFFTEAKAERYAARLGAWAEHTGRPLIVRVEIIRHTA